MTNLSILLRMLLRKFLRMSAVLLGVTLTTFWLMHIIPGSPWNNSSTSLRMMANVGMDQATQQALDHRFGLDLPLWRQFTRYVLGDTDEAGRFFCGAVCGNLGPSSRQRGRSVQEILFEPPEGLTFWETRFGYSVRLVALGAVMAIGVGIPLGVLSATPSRPLINRLISVGLASLVSTPSFVFGLLAIIILAARLKIIKVLPDWDYPSNWIVPASVLAVVPLSNLARLTRAVVLNILNEDYVRAARARGLTQTRVMLVHVMRNALVPLLTFLGPLLMEMFTGLLIVENLYAFPGFGREYWGAVLALDYPMILGLTMLYATGMVFVNIGFEALSATLDPRLARLESAQ